MKPDWLTLGGLCLRDACGIETPPQHPAVHLKEAISWLSRAQDATESAGVARSYALRYKRMHRRRGWLQAYPETTGYIIPTFFNYSWFSGESGYRQRAIRMAQWEIEVQMSNGAVQGGVVGFPPSPAVFNTGQVLLGWARAFHETQEPRFREAAIRAAEFLVAAQDSDGGWRRNGSRYARPGVNLYDARTAWGLFESAAVSGKARHREAALQNLEFVLRQQRANGWFPNCCLDDNDRPLLHTIAYTMEGLLEVGATLKEARYIEAARRPADALLTCLRADGSLAGRFDSEWRPAVRWSCLTGNAQIAVVWFRLFQLTNERKYFEAAQRMNRFLMRTQNLTTRDPGVRGGIKGSQPIWAEYAPFEYPNWAAKFFADALLLELGLDKGDSQLSGPRAVQTPGQTQAVV